MITEAMRKALRDEFGTAYQFAHDPNLEPRPYTITAAGKTSQHPTIESAAHAARVRHRRALKQVSKDRIDRAAARDNAEPPSTLGDF